ncbi:MAG: protein phosphatase 2C domain-containing protein [Planctomycetes bacterium]|nr:protein phosphatase 2C domain-containing protein [Planctomycetota bacterium]
MTSQPLEQESSAREAVDSTPQAATNGEALCEPDVRYVSIAGGTAALYTARCPGKATPNEDALLALPFGERSAVLAVADGLGGVRAGERASALVVEALETTLKSLAPSDSLASGEPLTGNGAQLRTAILDAIETANRRVREMALGAASTLAAVEIHEGTVLWYHVGDSTILVTGQRGRVKTQTIPHSPVGYAVESGLLDADAALHHDDRHLVSNVIGSADMRIEIGSAVRLKARDTVLLASDGLSDNLLPAEIVDLCRTGSLPTAVERLTALARQRMNAAEPGHPSKPDDLSVILFRMG